MAKWELTEWGNHRCSVCKEEAEEIKDGGKLVGGSSVYADARDAVWVDQYDEFLSPFCPYCGAKMEDIEDEMDEEEEE